MCARVRRMALRVILLSEGGAPCTRYSIGQRLEVTEKHDAVIEGCPAKQHSRRCMVRELYRHATARGVSRIQGATLHARGKQDDDETWLREKADG